MKQTQKRNREDRALLAEHKSQSIVSEDLIQVDKILMNITCEDIIGGQMEDGCFVLIIDGLRKGVSKCKSTQRLTVGE